MSEMMMMMMMMMTLMAGINLRTGDKGIFPLAHVVDVDYNDFDPAGVEVTVNNNIASSVTVPVFILICPRFQEKKERYLLDYLGSVQCAQKGVEIIVQVT